MRLKNKKTGEIVSLEGELVFDNEVMLLKQYSSLAELNEEWGDMPEEPKEHYEILSMGAVMEREDAEDEIFRNQGQKEIGNYFDTREEAELAVRKLKAWKRLKDKGLRFEGWDIENSDGAHQPGAFFNEDMFRHIDSYKEVPESIKQDLDLLFRGEE